MPQGNSVTLMLSENLKFILKAYLYLQVMAINVSLMSLLIAAEGFASALFHMCCYCTALQAPQYNSMLIHSTTVGIKWHG